MSESTSRLRPLRSPRLWLLAFAVWSLPVVVFSVLPVLMQPEPSLARLRDLFLRQGAVWYLWAFFTPLILQLARRWPLGYGRQRRFVLRHVLTATALGILFNIAFMAMNYAFRSAEWPAEFSFSRALIVGLTLWLPFTFVVYALLVSMGLAIEYSTRLRERELAATRLESRLFEAQLATLRMQLQPHFLFNALNTIAMLVRSGDTRTSVRMLARLSELLRQVLDGASAQEIALEEEIRLVERYLEIEQLRFGDRMSVTVSAPECLRDALVPNLLLQPIVENAIRHGISRRAASGRLEVHAERAGDDLVLRVVDDGPGLPPEWHADETTGIGIRNTRARLAHLYGSSARFTARSLEDGGVEVTIVLPYHTQHATEPVHA
jgi:two-component sensor histidine kinase